MEIKLIKSHFPAGKKCLIVIMRVMIFFMCTTVFCLTTDNSFSQVEVVIEKNESVVIDEVFKIIKKQTDYSFVYPKKLFLNKPKVSLKKGKISVSELLNQSLLSINLSFEFTERNTILIKKKPVIKDVKPVQREIKGSVTSSQGDPLSGVSIIIVGTTNGTTSDFDGNYIINANKGDVLRFSYVGMKTVEIIVGEKDTVNVVLEEDSLALSNVIITGTARKTQTALETSYGVAILGPAVMDREMPVGVVDLIDAVPGLYGEPSGGDVNTLLTARGTTGGFNSFISLQEDGLPVLYTPFLTEYEIRPDATYDRIETVLGGPSGIFTAQGAAASVNFISRIPKSVRGEVRLAVTDYGRIRTDLFYGGPINDNGWYATIGGYYRRGDGVRDVGFTGDHGGQIRANLKKVFENGDVTFSYKGIRDHSIFYWAVPTDASGDGNPKAIPGLDPRNESLMGPDVKTMHLKTRNGTQIIDLDTGQESITDQFSVKFNYDLGSGFRVKEHARISNINTNGVDLRTRWFNSMLVASDYVADQTTVLLDAFPSAVSTQLVRVNDGQVVNNPSTLNGNGLLLLQEMLSYQKEHRNFINDFQLTYEKDNFIATAGLQYWDMATKSSYVSGHFLTDAKHQSERYDIEALDANGDAVGHLTDAGVVTHSLLDNHGSLDTRSTNPYLNIQVQPIEGLWLDAGIRHETVRFNATGEGADGSAPLDPSSNILANRAYGWFARNGQLYNGTISASETTWTVGANFKFSDNFAVYGRYTKAHDFAASNEFSYFNAGTPNLGLVNDPAKLNFGEIGLRYQSKTLAFWATAFFSENLGFPVRSIDPETAALDFTAADNKTSGIEFSSTWKPITELSFEFSGVIQSSKIEKTASNDLIVGKRPARIPNTQLRFVPTFNFNKGKAYVSAQYVGNRFADGANSLEFDPYTSFDAGVNYDFTDNLMLSLQATNLTNVLAYTQGNPNDGNGPVDVLVGGKYALAQALPGTVISTSLIFKF
ncbi:TonB-dependent receptor [Flavivirga amylovorans]|uniref:TonB-dependent receptor n=1 Tax=Flavivirga amylovorans TaxID=870486 RepID=A0ABT8WVT5_9FLAO|nr:TonB-dependent receptor [Flavivirga amylovorans]MDO5985776.1 TonB-dependent receptor [Flavivirga amylovorans]